jgi:hypothetical protein
MPRTVERRDATRDHMHMNNQSPTRFDYALRDLLVGDHDLTQLDHEQRVIFIAELIEVLKAVEACGWQRHTGDWDWFISIDEILDFVGTTLEFVTGTSDNDVTACVDYPNIVRVRLLGLDDRDPLNYEGPTEMDFFIDKIKSIHIECN